MAGPATVRNVGGVGAVAADDRAVQASGTGLLDLKAELDVQVREQQDVGVLRGQLGQLHVVVLDVGAGVLFDGEDFALEVLNESILQADSVSVSVVEHDAGGLIALLIAVGRSNGTLERVDEAGTEDVVADFGNSGVGAEGGDGRALRVLRDRSGSQHALRGVRADDGDDLFFLDQLLIDVGGLLFGAFGVHGDELDRILLGHRR